MKNILLIQLRQLGDILLTTPCIREIKIQSPNSKISFLSHKMGEVILKDCPYLDNLIVYDDTLNYMKQFQFVLNLKKLHFDYIIDFMNNPRSALYSALIKAHNKISFKSKRKFIYTQTIPKPSTAEYIVLEKFRLLKQIGLKPKNIDLILPWHQTDSLKTLEYLNNIKEFNSSPIRIVLSPTHRRLQRMWPLKNFAAIADFLVKHLNAFVIWLWGPKEEHVIDECMSYCKEKTFKAPPTKFREMAALIANHDIFIGNSNGPSHVAVATKILSLQLHGPTNAISWCPQSLITQYLQSTTQNINDINVETVITKCTEMLPLILQHSQIRQENKQRICYNDTPYSTLLNS